MPDKKLACPSHQTQSLSGSQTIKKYNKMASFKPISLLKPSEKIIERVVQEFQPMASPPQFTHPLQPQPLGRQEGGSVPVPQGVSPSTSALMWKEFHGKDYSVTKINTQGVPFVFLVTPDFYHLQPESYANEKITLSSPTCAAAVEAITNPFVRPYQPRARSQSNSRNSKRSRTTGAQPQPQPGQEIEMTVFGGITQADLDYVFEMK